MATAPLHNLCGGAILISGKGGISRQACIAVGCMELGDNITLFKGD
jgi:hypothetical protein